MPLVATKNLTEAWSEINPTIPNMEMFIVPSTYTTHTSNRDWDVLNYDDITDILNQTQIKARRVIPSRGFSFLTKNPKVVKSGFMAGKGNDLADTVVY